VASRTSAFSFKGSNVPIDSIGRALRVAHVLEGSVRRSADRVRVTAQLIDAVSGYDLWSGSYDREIEDLLTMQTEIGTDIARVLSIELVERATGSAGAASVDPGAYDAYLRGLYYMNGLDYASARRQLELAVAGGSGFAPAWAALSDAYNQLGRRDEARSAALRAIEADSTLAEAYAALAYIDFFYDRNWPAAEQHLARALALNSTFVPAIQRRSYAYVTMGRAAEAVDEIDRAAALDPLSPRIAVDQGIIYTFARRYDLAERHFRRMLAADSGSVFARSLLGQLALIAGRREEAARWFAEGDDSLHYSMAVGDTARAVELLAARERSRGPDNALSVAQSYAWLGMPVPAFRWLDRGLAEGERLIMLAAVDPLFDPVRSDPRMSDFLERLGPPWAVGSSPRPRRP
jgi:Flp pilus assembly protein TadD